MAKWWPWMTFFFAERSDLLAGKTKAWKLDSSGLGHSWALRFFFEFKPKQHTRSHLNEGYPQNCIFEKHNHLQDFILTKDDHPLDCKTINPHYPYKNIVLCLQRLPTFSSRTALIIWHQNRSWRFSHQKVKISLLENVTYLRTSMHNSSRK